MCCYNLYGADRPLIEWNPWRTENETVVFIYLHSSFSFVQYYAIKAEIDLELQPFISEDQNKKNAQLIRSVGKRLTTQIQVMAGKHG